MAPRLPSVTLEQAMDLAERLRTTTQQMAVSCSVDMALWNEHSNAVLEAASILAAYRAAPAAPAPDADGWIAHDGGPCPVGPETKVSVRMRDGFESYQVRQARHWVWRHSAGFASRLDIIAYRRVRP